MDGFTAEVLKMFWGNIKYYVQRAINSCYKKGQLSLTLKKGIITCLPKGTKDRKFIKNWRPISVLCVVYKLASAVIAEWLKPNLEKIVSQNQNGFISGRHMSENTRLIYDILSYTEKYKIPGLLMSVDFEKAFDSVSWDFMYATLDYFGFDEAFIKWIKLFNADISLYVLQCGFLSKPIPVYR